MQVSFVQEQKQRREREAVTETPTKHGLFLANENLLCLPFHPDARTVGFQITVVNFAQLLHAWLPLIWVFVLPFSLLPFVPSFILSVPLCLSLFLLAVSAYFFLYTFMSLFSTVLIFCLLIFITHFIYIAYFAQMVQYNVLHKAFLLCSILLSSAYKTLHELTT